MGEDPEGRALLNKLNLDGFVAATPELYQAVTEMMRDLGEL